MGGRTDRVGRARGAVAPRNAAAETAQREPTIVAADLMGAGIVMRPLARTGLRALRPAVWPVLLDVALDAEWRDGRLVASTSARLVAEHLRIDPGTAAAGLRTLREHGLVELSQASGADGRFGLAIYTLHLPDGIEVCSPHTEKPHTDMSHMEKSDTASTGADSELVFCCPWDGDVESPPRVSSDTVRSLATTPPPDATGSIAAGVELSSSQDRLRVAESPTAAGEPTATASLPVRGRRRAAALAPFGQGELDLGRAV